jgi:Rho family protein
VILVGELSLPRASLISALKCDLREEPDVKEKLYRRGLRPVSYEEGLSSARAIRATRYLGECCGRDKTDNVECSAKHNRGVQEAIHEAARAGLGGKPKGGAGGDGLQDRFRNRRCIIL